MTGPRLARFATDLLADEVVDDRPPSADAEARTVDALAVAIRRSAQRRRAVRIGGVVAVAAAAVLTIGFARTWSTPTTAPSTATATPAAPAHTIESAARLASSGGLLTGDRVRVSDASEAGLVLVGGTKLRGEAGSEFTLTSLSSTRSIRLERGAVRADVEKLGPGERFIVATADAEVEVHGTSFRVALAAPSSCSPVQTRVRVFEGVVAVRAQGREERLFAGDHWPRECDATSGPSAVLAPAPATPGARSPDPAPVDALPAQADPGQAPVGAPAESAPRSNSTLAEQNRLFAEATAARRRGDHAAAVAAYERLLARRPDAFLEETATAERMRSLEPVDRGHAREAARAYLVRYPDGFARADAERLAR